MPDRDQHRYTLGPRVRAFEPSLDREVLLRRTDDGRVPGHTHYGRPIYSKGSARYAELGQATWYRNDPEPVRPGGEPRALGTWTVSTRILCGTFAFVDDVVTDDFGTLVSPEHIREELWLAEYRRSQRAQVRS